MKYSSYATLTILIFTVLFSSTASGFSLAARPKAVSSAPASQGLQVWFDGAPQLTTAYPVFYGFNVAAKTSSGLWITSLHWDFGDGATLDVPFSAQSYVSDVRYHQYSQPGTYTVTVTAYDNVGNSGSAAQQVTWPDSPIQPAQVSFRPTISNAIVQQGTTNLQLPSGGKLYLFGFVTGGAYSSTPFSNGQYASVSNVDGNLVAALAATTSNSNSFTTRTMYYSIGGASVSGYSSYTESYATDSTAGSSGVSDQFTVATSGSLVVVVALGGDEQCQTIAGLSGFSVDASNVGSSGQPNAITIGHAYLDANTYTVTEQTQQCAAGQDPNHAANLIGVFVFQPGQSPTAPTITSVSPIAPTNNQTITIAGSGFGSTPPQTVRLSDGSLDTYACNVDTPSLAIYDNGGGSHSWSAGRQSCTNTDSIGVYLQSWSDTQIVLGGFGTVLSTSGSGTWNIAAGDPLVINVWGPNENGPAQYSMTVSTTSMNRTEWAKLMFRTPTPRAGCFSATYPDTVWQPSQCASTPPPGHLQPSTTPESEGDYIAQSPSSAPCNSLCIGSSVGSFTSVTGSTTETDYCSSQMAQTYGCTAPGAGANHYTLQDNSNNFSLTSNTVYTGNQGASGWMGWEQFAFWSNTLLGIPEIGIQYWLLNYIHGTSGSCPNVSLPNRLVLASGWIESPGPEAGYTSCYANILPAYTLGVDATNLSGLSLEGSANLNGDGLDQVTLYNNVNSASVPTTMYARSEPDNVLNLYEYWTSSEFNVFGYNSGSEAQFNSGTSITVSNTLTDQKENPITPSSGSCQLSQSTTAETNNLYLVSSSCITNSGGQMLFTENTASPSTTKIICSPQSVPVGAPTMCGASVTGTTTTPSGTVTFSSSSSTGQFSPTSCTINANVIASPNIGSCTVAVSYSDTTAGTVTITGTYSGDQNNQVSSDQTTVIITSAPQAQALTTTVSGQGSVNPSCPSGCSEQVGSTITIKATPNSGYGVTWTLTPSVSGATCSNDVNSCSFIMPNVPATVTATFTLIGACPVGVTITVKVVDNQGNPISDANVALSPPLPNCPPGPLQSATTPEGIATLTPPPATYTLTASKNGMTSSKLIDVTTSGQVFTITLSTTQPYTVTFQEQGLDPSSGETWSVALQNGQTVQSSQGSYYSISFTEPNGNYPYTAAVTPQGQPYYYCPSPSSGEVTVDNGNPQPVTITINTQTSPCTAPASSYTFLTSFGSSGSGDDQFANPQGVAVDSSGNVYVTDYGNNRVEKFTGTGSFVAKWGSLGSGEGQLIGPIGIAVDSSGNVYVVANSAGIESFTSAGTFIAQWGSYGSGNGQFLKAYGVAVDSSGKVYVADSSNNRIEKFTSAGTFIAQWGSYGSGNGQFEEPVAVAVDSSGNIYVLDSGNMRIEKFDSSGNYITQWEASGLGIAVDSLGNIYVADTGNNRVEKFTSTGVYITAWGCTDAGTTFCTSGSGPGQFNGPTALAVDSSGNVYVADTMNNRIEVFQPSIATASVQYSIASQRTGLFSGSQAGWSAERALKPVNVVGSSNPDNSYIMRGGSCGWRVLLLADVGSVSRGSLSFVLRGTSYVPRATLLPRVLIK